MMNLVVWLLNLVKDREQYKKGAAGLSGWSWSKTPPICLLHASVSTIYRLVDLGKTSRGVDKIFDWSDDSTCTYVSSKPSKWKGCPFISFLLSAAVVRAKFCTTWPITLHKTRNEFCHVCRLLQSTDGISFFAPSSKLFRALWCNTGTPFYGRRRRIYTASTTRWHRTISW